VVDVQAISKKLGLDVVTSEIRHAEDISPAFKTLKGQAEALYVTADALANSNRMRINALALAARLPTMYGTRGMVEAGRPHVLRRKLFGSLPARRLLCR
jgi:ABC-type uncharacterized transport system substrate-binding protein